MAEAKAGREIPARFMPVPDTVSPQLQNLIVMPPFVQPAETLPTTTAGWRAFLIEADKNMAAMMGGGEAMREALGVNVTKTTIAGVPCYEVTPRNITARNSSRMLVHVHGGAYVLGAGDLAYGEAVGLAAASGIKAISVDYRMPPEHPYPAAVDDAMAVYGEVLKTTKATNVGVFGTSAGGGLALAMVHRARRDGIAFPGALFVGTPWTDLTKTGDSYFTNEFIDNILPTYDSLLGAAARLYAGTHDIKHPEISPVYGDFSGFPPTLMTTGTRDLFLSNTVRAYRKLRNAGAEARIDIYEGASHGQYGMDPTAPEAAEASREAAQFLDQHLGT
jgi:acetyl esterase/lipase